MKRRDLEQHLRAYGCEPLRHGGRHDIWINTSLNLTSAVPRHNEIKNNTARSICRTLGVPRPSGS